MTLSGTVPTARPGEVVTVFAQTFGEPSLTSIATVLTTDGGVWRYLAKPRVGTTYQGALEWWPQCGGDGWRATRGVVPPNGTPNVRHTRFRRAIVRRPRRPVPATDVDQTLGDGQAGSTEGSLRSDISRVTSTRKVGATHRDGVNQAGHGYLAGYSRVIVYRR